MKKLPTTPLTTPSRHSGKRRSLSGRVCADPGCTTVLSTYNSLPVCWAHQVTKPIGGGPLRDRAAMWRT
jgi:hypothetical protein